MTPQSDLKQSPILSRRGFMAGSGLAGMSALIWPTETFPAFDTGVPGGDSSSQAPAAKMPSERELTDFVRLSEALTGVRSLNEDHTLASEYFQRCTTYDPVSSVLPQILQWAENTPNGEMETLITNRIMPDDKLRAATEQIIFLWYTSGFFAPNSDPRKQGWMFGTIEQYNKALIWHVIRAHPLMTQGGPYGYWSDSPTDDFTDKTEKSHGS